MSRTAHCGRSRSIQRQQIRAIVHLALDWRPNACLNHPMRLYQSLQDDVIEYRAVSIGLSRVFGPSIDMGVEINQCRRIVPFPQRAKERKSDAMIATKRD